MKLSKTRTKFYRSFCDSKTEILTETTLIKQRSFYPLKDRSFCSNNQEYRTYVQVTQEIQVLIQDVNKKLEVLRDQTSNLSKQLNKMSKLLDSVPSLQSFKAKMFKEIRRHDFLNTDLRFRRNNQLKQLNQQLLQDWSAVEQLHQAVQNIEKLIL